MNTERAEGDLTTVADHDTLRRDTAAVRAGTVRVPVVGLLIMGRKRPGFDPQWGASVLTGIEEAVAQLPWRIVTPSRNISDEASLGAALEACRADGVSVLVVVQPTISDGRLAPMIARQWKSPIVIWATPEKQSGEMISANSLVGSHVMAATLRQLGHPLEFVYGAPELTDTRAALVRAVRVCHSAASIHGAKLGLIGEHAPGFVDFHADPQTIAATFGSHIYNLGVTDLIAKIQSYDDGDLTETVAHIRSAAPPNHPDPTRSPADRDAALLVQARYYRAFRDLFAEERCDVLAFRCWPDLPTLTGNWPYLALAMVVDEGFPIAMEGDVDGAICSLIAESAGVGPVYLSDWLEHDESTITIWHTGAAPLSMTEGATLGVQFNNKLPTVVEGTIRPGIEATAFRIWRMGGRYHMVALEGRTIAPRRPMMATNGLFETNRVNVLDWFEEMVQQGMPHHLAIVEGHHRDLLRRVARLTDMVWVDNG